MSIFSQEFGDGSERLFYLVLLFPLSRSTSLAFPPPLSPSLPFPSRRLPQYPISSFRIILDSLVLLSLLLNSSCHCKTSSNTHFQKVANDLANPTLSMLSPVLSLVELPRLRLLLVFQRGQCGSAKSKTVRFPIDSLLLTSHFRSLIR